MFINVCQVFSDRLIVVKDGRILRFVAVYRRVVVNDRLIQGALFQFLLDQYRNSTIYEENQ